MIKEKWIQHNGKNVGYVIYDQVLDKNVYITHRKALFYFDDLKAGISISQAVLEMLRKTNVKEIRVVILKANGCSAVYITTVNNFDRNGRIKFYGSSDKQKFLSKEKFDLIGE